MTDDQTGIPLVATSVDRIILAVRDLDKAEAAYTRMFGRQPSWRRRDTAGGTAHVFYYLGNMGVELTAAIGTGVWGQHLTAFLTEHGEGISALCFASDNVERSALLLNDAGVSTIVMPENEGAACRLWSARPTREKTSACRRLWSQA